MGYKKGPKGWNRAAGGPSPPRGRRWPGCVDCRTDPRVAGAGGGGWVEPGGEMGGKWGPGWEEGKIPTWKKTNYLGEGHGAGGGVRR